MCVCACATQWTGGGRKMTCIFFFFLIMWILGIKHRSSAMIASTFTLCDISAALAFLNGPCISLSFTPCSKIWPEKVPLELLGNIWHKIKGLDNVHLLLWWRSPPESFWKAGPSDIQGTTSRKIVFEWKQMMPAVSEWLAVWLAMHSSTPPSYLDLTTIAVCLFFFLKMEQTCFASQWRLPGIRPLRFLPRTSGFVSKGRH